MTELPPDDPHHAEPERVDPQTSILEALDTSDVLARLERARAPGARAGGELLEGPTEEESAAWVEELRDFVESGARAQRAVDEIVTGACNGAVLEEEEKQSTPRARPRVTRARVEALDAPSPGVLPCQ